MKIESYSIASPIKGVCKSHGIWAQEGNKTAPLVYLQRPKWIPENEWKKIIDSIRLDLPAGYEIDA